jgi:hypothetical protein
MPGARKYIEVLIFVVGWMAAGWIFHLDANAYLLLGVPLVVFFQLFIRRRPLRNLWARDAMCFRLGMIGVVLAVLLILAPGYDLLLVALPKKLWVVALWLVCAMAGALFAAFAFGCQRASAARRGLPSFVVAVLIGIGVMAASALAGHHSIGFSLPKLVFLLKQFLLYFTVCFALAGWFFGVHSIHTFISLEAMVRRVVRLGFRRSLSPLCGGFGICLRFLFPAPGHLQR